MSGIPALRRRLDLFPALNGAILLVLFFVCIYPFYYIIIYSLSDPIQAQKGIVVAPAQPTLENFAAVFRLHGIANAAIVSLARTAIGTILTVFCCALFSYLVTREEMPARRLIYRLLIVTMYLNAGLIPWYLTMKMYQLNNNFLLYVIPSAISAFNVILIKTYIEQLPPSMVESAMMDGASHFTIFARIVFPLAKPIIATIVVFSAVGQWNTWFDNYFLVQDPKLRTLQMMLYDYLAQANWLATASNADRSRAGDALRTTPQTVRTTITVVVTLPIILVYPFMQRYFVKGIMMGAIKG